MVIVMDMPSGKRCEEPADPYGEEILNANWLPEVALRPRLQLVKADLTRSVVAAEDVEGFLASIYLYQE